MAGIIGDGNRKDGLKISIIDLHDALHPDQSSDLERMRLAVRSVNAGTWTLDLSQRKLMVCKRCKAVIPLCSEENVNLNRFVELIAGGYRDKIVGTILLALKTGDPIDLEVPLASTDHSCPGWLRVSAVVLFNDLQPGRILYGMVEDISCRKKSEQVKQNLMAMAGHDLRSPLSIINLYLQLCDRKADNHHLSEMLKKAALQVHKMNKIIQCYLDSSVMATGRISYSPETFDLKILLEEVISDMYLLYPGNILFLRPGPAANVYADREKVGRVVQNLLSNAIKYSARTDVITLHYKKFGDHLQVAVEDYGPGINSADQEKIFDQFYRAENGSGGSVHGYGIGLYLCKEIISRHNGKLWLESEKGQGSKFFFTLPLANHYL